MLIAGLAEGPDAAAALVELVDGKAELRALVYQQSVDRQPHSAAFPSAALDAVLDVAGRKPRDLDRIVVTGLRAVPMPKGASPGIQRVAASRRLASVFRTTGAYRASHDRAAARVEQWASDAGFRASISTVETDLAHAHLAYRTSGAGRVVVIVAGTWPDGAGISVFEARNGQIDPLPALGRGAGRASIAEVLRAQKPGERVILAGDAFAHGFGRDRLGPTSSVAPLLGNGGAALGAALWEAGPSPANLDCGLLGPGFTSDSAYKALSNAQQPRDRATREDVVTAATNALRRGERVAWAVGRAGSEADLLPGRALLHRDDGVAGWRLLLGDPQRAGDIVAVEPTLRALLTVTGPLRASPLARPGEPAALTPTDVIRVFRSARGDTPTEPPPALLVLDDYLVAG